MSDHAAMEVGALAARAASHRAKYEREAKRIARRLGWQDHYRRLFCDQETGELSASGIAVLRDLGREANFGVFDPKATDAELRTNEGSRRVLLHIYSRLSLGSDELITLSRKMKESDT